MYGICFSVLVVLCGFMMSGLVLADGTDVVDRIGILIPSSCTMSGTGMSSHNTEIPNGTYQADIGTSMIHAFCNDADGFAIYAAGYTGNEVEGTDSNKLIGTSASGNATIETGLAISAGSFDVSNWAMKLAITQDSGNTSGTNAFTIDSAPNENGGPNASFTQYHVVPTIYTKVAHKNAMTDMATSLGGIKFTTTYAAYISKTQPADTYTGQVIYTLVHPASIPAPKSTMLDTGATVCAKMKSLVAGTETKCTVNTSDIKAIRMTNELPEGFVPSDANTVSDATSKHPIYIFFDNTDGAGIMYFYSGGYQVVMNSDSSRMLRSNLALTDISALEYWDSSNVTILDYFFSNDNSLANWDVSNVESMKSMFYINSNVLTTETTMHQYDMSGIANWNTSGLKNMQQLFAGNIFVTNLDALTFWNTSNVENMSFVFAFDRTYSALGVYSRLSDISGLANWDVSKVKDMTSLFADTVLLSDISTLANWNTISVVTMSSVFGGSAITDVYALSNWDVSNVENMYMLFGVGSTEYNNGIRSQLRDISGLVNWETGSVTTMQAMFEHADKITDLSALANWDVSSVSTMKQMFNDTTSLIDVSAIKDWDVNAVTATAGSSSSSTNNFYHMFNSSGVIPEPFTLRSGIWDSSGTFIPSS